MQDQSITPDEFLETVFPPDLLRDDEMVVIACPDSFVSRETGKTVDYYRQRAYTPRALKQMRGEATYFCVSTMQRQRSRQVKKRLADCHTAFVLVVDDIGTKCDPPPLTPSYILQTSRVDGRANTQWGYLIEPWPTNTPDWQHAYDTVLYSLAQAGMNDPGCRSASRLMRLPDSVHRTGFWARITHWNPDRYYDLETLLERMEVPRVEPSRGRHSAKPGAHLTLDGVDDYIFDFLKDRQRLMGSVSGPWVAIECPWRHEHTDGAQGATSTGYSPDGFVTEGRGFKCMHGHCAHRTTRDFLEWAHENGAVKS